MRPLVRDDIMHVRIPSDKKDQYKKASKENGQSLTLWVEQCCDAGLSEKKENDI